MVAQFNSEMFAQVSHTPRPIPSDPDDVRLALETAQAFQEMGNISEAVAWLELAAERAEAVGQLGRVIELVQATAKLINRSEFTPRPASTVSSPPSSEVRDRDFVRAPAAKLPPCPPLGAGSSLLPARPSSLPPPPRKSLPPAVRTSSLPPVPMLSAPTSVAPDSAPPASLPRSSLSKGPPRASVPPKRSSRVLAPATRGSSQTKTIRVAIAGLVPGCGSFSIEQLAKGEPLPAGTKEATIVISDHEGRIEVVMRG